MILLTSEITGADIVATYRTFVFVAGVVLAIWGQGLGRPGHWRTPEDGNKPLWADWGGRWLCLAFPLARSPAPRADRACRLLVRFIKNSANSKSLLNPTKLINPLPLIHLFIKSIQF